MEQKYFEFNKNKQVLAVKHNNKYFITDYLIKQQNMFLNVISKIIKNLYMIKELAKTMH